MDFVSFVVDGLAIHYYQAELLLFSLSKFAKQPKENVLVHCTTRVDTGFIGFLQANGYPHKIIEPVLDGKYCNKIIQLDSFRGIAEANVFLLDTDMFVLEPLAVPDPRCFSAKTVDAPNPPLAVLTRIFAQAGLDLPPIIHADWQANDAKTVSGNFNGGFYYIPNQAIDSVFAAWFKWADWLYQRQSLFDSPQQAIHIDQVSMALAIHETKTPYRLVTANYNCPIHSPSPLSSLDQQAPIRILHYHREINGLGHLKAQHVDDPFLLSAIEKANQAMQDQARFEYYAPYRKSLVRPVEVTDTTAKLRAALSAWNSGSQAKPLKLILHAGTPKTASTSLQFFLAEHRQVLRQHGYLYPNNVSGEGAPKHQWLVDAFMHNNADLLIEKLAEIRSQLQGTDIHTLILSTEGIYNHWFDYNQEAKSFLSVLADQFAMELWVWFREPVAFVTSLYRQYLKNPKLPNVKCYGQDWSLSQMLSDEWFVKHLDYLGFVYETESLFGRQNIRLFEYKGNVVAQACHQLGLTGIAVETIPRRNPKLSAAASDLLRVINRYPIDLSDKKNLIELIGEMDKILGKYLLEASGPIPAEEPLIKAWVAMGLWRLEVEFGFTLVSEQAVGLNKP